MRKPSRVAILMSRNKNTWKFCYKIMHLSAAIPWGLTPGNPRAFAPRHFQIPPTQGHYSSTKKATTIPPPGEHNLKGLPNCNIGNPGSLCVTRDITQVNHREHMRRSLGLKICFKMEIKIDETYHVASFCCP